MAAERNALPQAAAVQCLSRLNIKRLSKAPVADTLDAKEKPIYHLVRDQYTQSTLPIHFRIASPKPMRRNIRRPEPASASPMASHVSMSAEPLLGVQSPDDKETDPPTLTSPKPRSGTTPWLALAAASGACAAFNGVFAKLYAPRPTIIFPTPANHPPSMTAPRLTSPQRGRSPSPRSFTSRRPTARLNTSSAACSSFSTSRSTPSCGACSPRR